MLSRFIARHYLFAHRRKSVINVISWISLIGLGVGAGALIVVLSVYNGIGRVTQNLFNVFDPEALVQPVKGKTFHLNDIPFDALQKTKHVRRVSQLVEENAWITHGRNSAIVTLRGVDNNYRSITRLDTMLQEGVYLLSTQQPPTHYMLLGSSIYDQLGITATDNTPLSVNIPKRNGAGVGMTATDAFNTGYAYPAGNFYVQQDADAKYVVTNIEFVRQLMNYAPDEVTALAIELDSPKASKKAIKDLRGLLGDSFRVANRLEQQPLYYKVYRSERLGIYFILSLIVLIATLNLIASLSLLIIDKRRDIGILQSMGMNKYEVRRVFFSEGLMICAIGAAVGMLLGFVVCLLQQQFGIVKMGSDFLVQAFPVEMHAIDFVATFLLVMGLSSLSVWFTVRKAKI
ncbi:MAG: FtsX-like permease family protein [Bacteroidales bacterium]|nr:FtsX-like permease family protein [Bacteroidales bacterium]